MDLVEARAAYDAREWVRGFDLFTQAGDLDFEDLDRYAICAQLSGRLDDYFAIRERAYTQHLDAGDLVGAAEMAIWIGVQRMVEGEVAAGSGWLARAGRHVEEDGTDSPAAGFLQLAQALGQAVGGDLDAALAQVAEAVATCRRHGRHDLVAMALHQEGLVLLEAGRTDEGLARLDEAMVTLDAEGVSALVTGIVYCGAIAGCWAVYELRRAQEWTEAMTAWCDAQPQLGIFTSECKVRRAELKQLRGAWPAALDELAGVSPADIDAWAAGAAASVRGNIDRLQGRYDDADDAFRTAASLGFDPQPGLALLRLAQGSVQAAAAMIRRCLAEVREDARRIELLSAAVEILLAVGDPEQAAAAAAELAAVGNRHRIPIVEALTGQAQATLHLADSKPELALPAARAALRHWVAMRAPYQEARTRTLLAEACRALGDTESATREADQATTTFVELGATPDLARLRPTDDLLTPREVEVLRLVATGVTNRAIAEQLVLSERTVDRHLSNIFTKLGVSSRAAATAYAFERQLV